MRYSDHEQRLMDQKSGEEQDRYMAKGKEDSIQERSMVMSEAKQTTDSSHSKGI